MQMQDFSKRHVIVVRDDLPSWQAMNTVAHIAAYFGNKIKEPFDTGEYFITQDGARHPRNSQYPIVILSASNSELRKLIIKTRDSGLLYLGFIREMIETTDDAKIEAILRHKSDEVIEYLGIGLFGPNDVVKEITKKFHLWK